MATDSDVGLATHKLASFLSSLFLKFRSNRHSKHKGSLESLEHDKKTSRLINLNCLILTSDIYGSKDSREAANSKRLSPPLVFNSKRPVKVVLNLKGSGATVSPGAVRTRPVMVTESENGILSLSRFHLFCEEDL